MKQKILCIDDESHNLEALQRLLRKHYDVEVAESGAAALEKLADHQFSLIISDQKMPNMTGVEFFQEAKKTQPDAVRILLTGYTDLESVINAINEGQIYRYITKPWEPEEFLSIVRQGLDVFDMQQTIKQQNEQLTVANQELRSLDQLKAEFMLLVNHELKTPLTGIFSYLQLLQEEKLPEDSELYVNRIHKNTQRLQDLINDTLLITKLKSASKKPEVDSVDIAEIIQSQWQTMEPEFVSKNLELKFESANNTFSQTINKVHIHTVIKKLIHNSFQHSHPGTTVVYSLSDQPDHWSLTTENQLEKPLEQDASTLLQAFATHENILNHSGGTGLGLAVIKTISELFGGTLELESKDLSFKVSLKFNKPK